jgi:hypothetical protein
MPPSRLSAKKPRRAIQRAAKIALPQSTKDFPNPKAPKS